MLGVGIAVNLLTTTTELSFKVGQLASELENSGGEFSNVLDLFTATSKTLDYLHGCSTKASLPPSQTSNYTSQLKRHKNRFNDIEGRLRSIKQDLKSKTRLSRLLQPHDFDWRKLTDDIRAFNDNLKDIAMSLTPDNDRRIEPVSAGELDKEGRNINSQYVGEIMKMLEEERRRATTPPNPLGNTDIQTTASTDIYVGTVRRDSDLPPYPPVTNGVHSQRTQRESIIVTDATMTGYSHNSKLPIFLLTEQVPNSTGPRRCSSPDIYGFPQMEIGERGVESSQNTENLQGFASSSSFNHYPSIHQSTLRSEQGQESAALADYDDPWDPYQSTETLQEVMAIGGSPSLNRYQNRYQNLLGVSLQPDIFWHEQPKDDESMLRLFKEIDGRLTDHILNFYVAQNRETYDDEASTYIESSVSELKHLLLRQDSRIFSLRAIIANKIIRMASKEAELYISTPSTSLHKSHISRLARNIHSETKQFALNDSISSARLNSMEVVMRTAVNFAFTMANQPTKFEFSWPFPITGGPPDKVLLDPNTMEVVYRVHPGDMRVITVFPGLLKQKKMGESPLAKAQVLLY